MTPFRLAMALTLGMLALGSGCALSPVDCGRCKGKGSIACGRCNGKGKNTCGICLGTKVKCCDPCEGRPGNKAVCENCKALAVKKNCPACAGHGTIDCRSCESGKDAQGKPCARCGGAGSHMCGTCYPSRTSPCVCCCHGALGGGAKVEHHGGPCGICKASGMIVCTACHGKAMVVCTTCDGKGKVKPGSGSSSSHHHHWGD